MTATPRNSRASRAAGAFVAAICLAGCCLPLMTRATPLYVARRGWHVDVGFASNDLDSSLAPLAGHLPGARFLFLGFGDRRYVLSAHHGGPVLLEALWPGAGVVLATGLVATPTQAFGTEVVTLDVSPEDAANVQRAINASLSDEGVLPGPYKGSLYFNSSQRYSGLHTCNTWAAEMLKAGHLPLRSRGVVFAGQLWRQVKKIARKQEAARQVQAARVGAPPPVQ